MRKADLVNYGIITILILFSISLVLKTDTTHYINSQNENFQIGKLVYPLEKKDFSYDLVPHVPIEIDSDNDFVTYGFNGTGSGADPYIIEGYNITTTSDYGIYIQSTTKYFVIRNCYIDADMYSIQINAVATGTATITNNTCTNNKYDGILLSSSPGSTLIKNTCTNNYYEDNYVEYGSGISLDSSSDSTLTKNTCTNNFRGIFVEYSSGSALTNNTCTNNDNSGICLISSSDSTLINNTCTNNNYYGFHLYSSSDSTLINNTCTNNNYRGINLSSSSSSTLTKNTCTNHKRGISLDSSSGSALTNNTCTNNEYGISLSGSGSCLITYNLLQENEGYGVCISESYNIIHHNTFVDNNLEGFSQALDYGVENIWYDPTVNEGNYWSDLGNYCYYQIDGEGGIKDLYPLNVKENCVNPKTMTILSIVLPIIFSGVLLTFLLPRYILPYTRKHVLPYIRKRREMKRKEIEEKVIEIEEAKYCLNCGNRSLISDKFCRQCGTTLE